MTATLAPPNAAAERVARPALILLVACVAQFMLLVDDTITNVALPTIQADLGFTESSLSWVVNAYLLTFGGFLLIGGRLADRFGPRRLFAVALAGFATASALCGLAPTSEVLIGARAAQGVMGALLSPAALAILLATYPEGAARRRALSAWAALMGLGAATGLIAGGALVELADWRWIFLVNLPVAAVALAAVPRVLPSFDATRARPAPNVTGATLATMSLLLLVFTVVETDDHGWTSARSLAGFAGAALLAALFFVSERRAASPLIPRELIRRPRAMWADATVFIAAGGLLAMFFFMTLYLQRVLELSALQTGLAFLPFSVTMGIVSGVVGRLPDRIDARLPIAAGLLVGAAGLYGMSRLGVDSSYAGAVLPTLVVVAAGLALAFVPVMGLATGDAEERDGGLSSGLMTSAQQVGGAIGIAVLTTVATSHTGDAAAQGASPAGALVDGFQAAFRVEAAVMIAAALLALATLRRRRA
jgi:EmrB/QacA subfamily drug resistance transporter